MDKEHYKIKLEHFEGPFDLLLFFIERDELNIYDIPIHKLITDFIDYIHSQEHLNIELSSEFILFVSILMRIKAKMLIPRKEIDASGNEIDPRDELVHVLLEYKKYKQIAFKLSEIANERMQFIKRGNVSAELNDIGEKASEGTEINHLNLFKLMKSFEKIIKRNQAKKASHTVYKFNYSMEEVGKNLIQLVKEKQQLNFEKLFETVENRLHAVFCFLNLLDFIQQKFIKIYVGEGINNFIIEWNKDYEKDILVSEFRVDNITNN
ncbi:MAG: segregation/condensation protein A [Alphaproteobacteria bacterium]|nr:segregation/condensation protein A [Alphaproteobacteria bacterium]